MYELPTSITMGEQSFTIRNQGDYRMVIDCFICLEDPELSEQERIAAMLMIFLEDMNDLEDLDTIEDLQGVINEIFNFFNCGQPDNHVSNNRKLIDWDKDAMLVCSAVNNVAKTEIRALPYLHWWTFMGYYMSVNESFLSTIVSIRSKINKGKKLEKYEQEFKTENPQYFNIDFRTNEEKRADSLIRNLWNSNKSTNGGD